MSAADQQAKWRAEFEAEGERHRHGSGEAFLLLLSLGTRDEEISWNISRRLAVLRSQSEIEVNP